MAFILDLMSLSWGLVAGAFMAPYLYGLFWKGTTRAGAIAGMVSAIAIMLAGFFLYHAPNLPFTASVAMLAPFIVVPVVSLFTAKPDAPVIEKAFS